MLAMGSDWPHRGHPQRTEPTSFPTLPRFAELFSPSSVTASDTIPSYDRFADSELVLRSTPPTMPALSAPVNAERQSWTTDNHASSQASIAELSIPAIAPGYQFQRYTVPQMAMPRGSALTSEVCLNLQDAAHTQTPISARQDSAVLSSLDFTSSSSTTRSPRSAHCQPGSRSGSHSSTQSSPIVPADVPLPKQTNSHPTSHSSQRSRSKSLTSGTQSSVPLPRLHEHLGDQTSLVDIKPASKSTAPSSLQDQTNGNNNTIATAPPRQGRYNVRFAANYTSENMPSSQKHRQDPPPAVPASTASVPNEQPSTSQEQPTPTEEPSIQLLNSILQTTDSQQQHQSRPKEGDSSVERCQGCNEAWRRPLPNIEQFRQVSPAETGHELSMTSHNLIAQLRDHRLKADAAYDQWKWHHSHCIPREGYVQPTSPSSIASHEDAHTKDLDGVLQNNRQTETPSNKRKSDMPHEEGQPITSKLRKVTFDSESTAPPVRPSAPA